MEKVPSMPGLYWAHAFYSKKWDHIINIKGESPFLNYVGWNLNYPLHFSTKDNGLIGVNPTKFMFGDIISTLPDIGITIKTPEKQGIYWTLLHGHLVLTYITGVSPYMSCFTWDTCSISKNQILDAGNLTYLIKVEEIEYED